MRIFLGALLTAALWPSLVMAQAAPSPSSPIVVVVTPPSEPAAPEPAAELTSSPNWALLAPGIALFGGGWIIGWLTTIVWNVASVECHHDTSGAFLSVAVVCDAPRGPYGAGDWQMAIPLVGPWLTFVGDDTFRGADIAFPIAMEALQVAGLGLAIAGLASPRTVTRRGAAELQVGVGSIGIRGTF